MEVVRHACKGWRIQTVMNDRNRPETSSVMKELWDMLSLQIVRAMFKNRRLLWEMTKRELSQRYLGSFLGILWAFIQPTATVLIFWFVFEVGFKSMPIDNFPFILWLVCGMIPWFYIQDAIGSAAGAILENTFLVKKMVFQVDLLPLVKIASALCVHIFFIGVLFLLFFLYGYGTSIYNLQVIYYFFAMSCLILGITWLTSSLMVFLRDVGQFVAMILQFVFWGTPIFWNLNMIPDIYQPYIVLNPVYYIVEGYRDAFIYHHWFWESPELTLCFWGVTVFFLLAGGLAFRRLQPHFADVL